MKAFVNVLLGLLLLAVVACIVLFFVTRDREKDAAVAPPVPTKKIVYMSSSGVVANIERRLSATAGFAVEARCPKKVDESIGTTFRCSVRRVGSDDRIAKASVEIVGAGGQFRWTSTPARTRATEETPAP